MNKAQNKSLLYNQRRRGRRRRNGEIASQAGPLGWARFGNLAGAGGSFAARTVGRIPSGVRCGAVPAGGQSPYHALK